MEMSSSHEHTHDIFINFCLLTLNGRTEQEKTIIIFFMVCIRVILKLGGENSPLTDAETYRIFDYEMKMNCAS